MNYYKCCNDQSLMSRQGFDTVIYHGNCPDGFTAAWAFWEIWGYNIEYLPYRYGQDPPDVTGKTVAIVDFSFKRQVLIDMAKQAKYLVVLDHHKTAENDLAGLILQNSEIIFDMDRSGAQIAWDYLNNNSMNAFYPYSANNRPWVVDYVADRDLWRHALPNTKEISQALFFDDYFQSFEKMHSLLFRDDCSIIYPVAAQEDKDRFAERGKVLLEYKEKECEYYAKAAKPTRFIVGTSEYLVNLAGCPRALRSEVGNIICSTQDCDFAGVYWYDFASREWWVSFRASKDSQCNLSEITAQLPNGGGHPKAAGFTIYGNKGESLETYFLLL